MIILNIILNDMSLSQSPVLGKMRLKYKKTISANNGEKSPSRDSSIGRARDCSHLG